MTFIDLNRPGYIRRERVYIDSQSRLPQSKSEFDGVWELPKRFYNIQSIELVDYSIPYDIGPTFVAKTDTAPGNNLLDVYLHTTDMLHELTFTVEIEPTGIRYATTTDIPELTIQQLMNDAMDAAAIAIGDLFFTTGTGASWSVTKGGYSTVVLPETGTELGPGGFDFHMTKTAHTDDEFRAYFLFGTGRNRGNTPARVFGMNENEDTLTFDTIEGLPDSMYTIFTPDGVYGPRSSHIATSTPFRYVDIFVKELIPSFFNDVPLARIYFPDLFYNASKLTTPAPRLLTTPIPYTDRLNIKLLLENDVKPITTSTNGWNLTLDILTISSETNIPNWVNESIEMN